MPPISPLLLCIAAHALQGPLAHRPRLAPRRATALDKLDAAVDSTLNKTRSWGPTRQAAVVAATYAAHAGALGRGSVLLPYQLVPNDFGLWQSVGFDSILGFAFPSLKGPDSILSSHEGLDIDYASDGFPLKVHEHP